MTNLIDIKRFAHGIVCFAVMFGAGIGWVAAADDATEQMAEERDADIERWVQRLSSEDPADRAEAYTRLKDYGPDALAHLNLAQKYLSGTAADLAKQLRDEIGATLDKTTDDEGARREWREQIKERENNLRKWVEQHSESFDGDVDGAVEEILKNLEEFRDEWPDESAGDAAERLKKAREAYEDMLRGMSARHRDLQKQIEEMWKRAEEARIQALKGLEGADGIQMVELSGGDITCTMITNGDRMTYRRDKSGAIEVTVQQKDQDEQIYRADSFESFKEEYPELVEQYQLTENGFGGLGSMIVINMACEEADDGDAVEEEADGITDRKKWEKK